MTIPNYSRHSEEAFLAWVMSGQSEIEQENKASIFMTYNYLPQKGQGECAIKTLQMSTKRIPFSFFFEILYILGHNKITIGVYSIRSYLISF